MSLYDYYRGPIDPTAVYRAWYGDLEVRFTRQPGETLERTARRLIPGGRFTGIERV